MSKKKVIYILSLGHSGSTFLDYLLSLHPDFVGLGEVSNIYSGKNNTEGTKFVCSCGEGYENCSLWSQIPDINNAADKFAYSDFYTKIITSLDEKYSGIIDSSKKKNNLGELIKMDQEGEIDLKIIFLVKDARSWAASGKGLLKENRKKFVPMWFRVIRWLNQWYKWNKGMVNFLEKHQLSHLTISYEDMCFKTQKTMNKIFEFSGADPALWSPENQPNTHIAHGNRTKLKSKDKTIRYDNRWFYDFYINLIYPLMPRVSRWNKELQSPKEDK